MKKKHAIELLKMAGKAEHMVAARALEGNADSQGIISEAVAALSERLRIIDEYKYPVGEYREALVFAIQALGNGVGA